MLKYRSWFYYHLLPITGYVALVGLILFPLWPVVGIAVAGNGRDIGQNMWNLWWLKTSLLHLQNPYLTDAIYYPNGTNLYLHTLNPINFLLSLPFHALFGTIVAFNAVVALSLIISGYATYLLANDLCNDRWAAFFAGLAVMTSAYLLAQNFGSHMQLMCAGWISFSMLALRRLQRQATRGNVALVVLTIVAITLADWYYLLFTLFWASLWILWNAIVQKTWHTAIPSIMALALSGALITPLALQLMFAARETPTASVEGGPLFRIEHSLDLADLLIPFQSHPLWGDIAVVWQSYKDSSHQQNKTAYLGIVVLVLAVFGIREHEGWFWLTSAIIFIILACGPQLQVGGWLTPIPMPGALIADIPFLNIARYPIRFIVITNISLALLAALTLSRIRIWLATHKVAFKQQMAIGAGLGGLLLLDQIAFTPITLIDVPPPYAELAQDPDDFAIVEVPMYSSFNSHYMLNQVVHGKPLVGGYTSRQMTYPFLDTFPLIQTLATAQFAEDILADDQIAIAGNLLHYFGVRYIVLHTGNGVIRGPLMETIARSAANNRDPLRYAIEGRTLIFYEVAPPSEPLPFLGFGPGWGPPREIVNDRVQRTIKDEAEITIYQAAPTMNITLTVLAQVSGELVVEHSGEILKLPLTSGYQTLTIPLSNRIDVDITLGLRPSAPIEVERIAIE